MNLRSVFFCAAILVSTGLMLATVPHALADDPNRVSQLKVSVWPEYDRPTALILIQGTLADTTGLPRDVSVLVPSAATGIIATYENSDGTLAAEQPFKSDKQDDGSNRITFTTKSANYHVEYYADLIKGAPDKAIDFAYKAAAPADQATLEIQQPLKATNFTVAPAGSSTRADGGFSYYAWNFSSVTAGQSLAAQAKYTKADANPSVAAIPTAVPVPSTNQAPAPSGSSGNSVFIVVGLVAIGLAGVLGFFVLQQRSRKPVPAPVAARRPRRGAKRGSGGSLFCTQCGRALTTEDNFCPNCGAKRRAA